ncbi:hypothetical protein NSPZN2_10983 [Nitrospira defluvii]|uniref:Uncharacterized protein n=1 Tax=Nitrospira defluvii TaxID=330214 RepID=A0ABM8QN13_9BACT|nr:hypothetical protein NSPZN2_10983 [Nitrospira defluvii]
MGNRKGPAIVVVRWFHGNIATSFAINHLTTLILSKPCPSDGLHLAAEPHIRSLPFDQIHGMANVRNRGNGSFLSRTSIL